MNYTVNEVYTFKLNSGEELVTKVLGVDGDDILIYEPLAVTPAPQGVGLVIGMFTADPKSETRLNSKSIAISALTDHSVKVKYVEATTGIKIPDKKLLLG